MALNRRTRLRHTSPRRRAEAADREAVRLEVFRRDGRCLLVGRDHPGIPRCVAPMSTVHHLRKAGQGGPYTAENLVMLCAGHNDWLETTQGARFGEDVGLVIRRGRTHDEAWRLLRAAGLVAYWWDGVA